MSATERMSTTTYFEAALGRARSLQTLEAALRLLLIDDALETLVETLLAARVGLDALATSSYDHHNGFEKLVLHQASGGQKLVLHAWWPETTAVSDDANLHDHRWNFATAVLAGNYQFVEFREDRSVSAAGDQVFKHRYSSPRRDGRYGLHPTGTCRLVPTKRQHLRRGDVYAMPCDAIHRISPDDSQPTVTLFVQSPPAQRSTRVYSPTVLEATGDIEVLSFGIDGYRRRLRRVIDHLSETPFP